METSKPKPDLMAGATSSARPAQDKRILAHLEHGAKAPVRVVNAPGWTIDGWTIGLFALLLSMCVMAWLLHERTITPDTFRSSQSSGATAYVAPRHAAPAQPIAEAPQAAAIVNVAADEAVVEPETPTAATVAVANAANPARTANAAPAPAPPQTPRAAGKPATRASATPPVSADTDVTLLAALVAHAGKPTVVTPERSRDVVERQDGDSTMQLLARCKQLGVIEGMLCRSRICSGRWDTDAACRAPAH
ncbi:hypothetical protein [Duganella margarita]